MNYNPFKNLSFMKIFCITVIVALIIVILFAYSTRSNVSPDALFNFEGSLIASLMTLLAAIIAWHAIQKQIQHAQKLEDERKQQAQQLEDERKQRELNAVKPLLALRISELQQTIIENIKTIRVKPFDEINIQPMSEPCIIAFQQAIKYADPSSSERLVNILLHFQVFETRSFEYKNDTRDSLQISSPEVKDREKNRRILDWAILLTLTNDIYKFARSISKEIPQTISKEQVKECLKECKIYETEHTVLYDVLKTEYKDSVECDFKRKSLAGISII